MNSIGNPGTEFAGKVAIVSGADTVMGSAIARMLALHGTRLSLVGRNSIALRKLESSLVTGGRDVVRLEADVRDPLSMQGIVMATVERFGAVNFAVNNAGSVRAERVRSPGPTVWADVISADHSALFYALRVQLPAIEAAGGGSVVNVASVYGEWGYPVATSSENPQDGVSGLTRSAARAWGGRGVRVNELQPGVINSCPADEHPGEKAADAIADSIPANRIGEPAEVAKAVFFLLSDNASYISGAHLAVDGGFAA
jgi:NAD(P)-dependent dehydrogenase (short-subunit alcohol dehydrogenase family)